MSSNSTNEWTIVSRKTKKTSKHRVVTNYCAAEINLKDQPYLPRDLEIENDKIEKAKSELQATPFFRECMESILNVIARVTNSYSKSVHEVVCYGLGSVTNNYVSRLQFSMLLLLREQIETSISAVLPCYAYDPAFNALDSAIIGGHSIELISVNEEGRRQVDNLPDRKISIFYMIHCDKPLYENLLEQNFKDGLSQLIIIGNSLHSMVDRVPHSKFKEEFPCIYSAIYDYEFTEKSKTTIEILEEIDKDIANIEKFRRATQELRQKVIGSLVLYSIIIYILGAFFLYFFFTPQEWSYRIYGLLPFLLFPFIVYLLKRALHWLFVRKISQKEEELQRLKDKRKDILENVMETETYKKAKEILEKFDPETKRKLEEEKKKEEENQQSVLATSQSGLRRRQVPGRTPQPGTPNAQHSPITSSSPTSGHNSIGASPRNGQPGTRQMIDILPRPVLPLNKTALDKIMEFMIGDGVNQRYALICRHCANHNGMALKEEFQYLAFRCAYCRFFNPARKQRPNAPPLPTATPRRPFGSTASLGSDGASEDEEKPESSAAEEALEMKGGEDSQNSSAEQEQISQLEAADAEESERGNDGLQPSTSSLDQ